MTKKQEENQQKKKSLKDFSIIKDSGRESTKETKKEKKPKKTVKKEDAMKETFELVAAISNCIAEKSDGILPQGFRIDQMPDGEWIIYRGSMSNICARVRYDKIKFPSGALRDEFIKYLKKTKHPKAKKWIDFINKNILTLEDL